MNHIDPQQKIQETVLFVQNVFQNAGFTDAVIAVSGGIDSAVSCAIAVQALGADHVFPILLPYGQLNKQGVEDGMLVTMTLQIPTGNIQTVDIEHMVQAIAGYDASLQHQHLRLGNIMARVRMIVVFDQAKKRNALVIGTENKTEHHLGYYTRFGDEASDVEPIINLYKTQVYAVATYLNIPDPLLTKAPTAGLWEGQTDEGEFGFSYKEADEILSLYFDEGKSEEEIIELIQKKDIVEKTLSLSRKNKFKQVLPYTVKTQR